MLKKHSPEQTRQRWKELASLTKFKTALKEGGQILHTVKGQNNVTYAIIRENSNYFIKYCKELKEAYTVSDFKYFGTMEKLMEKHSSYNGAKKRMEGLMHQIREDFKHLKVMKEMEDDEALLNAFDQVDSETSTDGTEPTNTPNDEVPTTDIPNGEDDVPSSDTSETPAVSTDTDTPPSAPDAAPEGGEPSGIDTTTDEPTGDEQPSGDGTDNTGEESGDDQSNDIQSALGKLQSEIQQLEQLTTQETKNILNTVISATKDGISQMSDEEKEEIANRIERDGHKIDETDTVTQGWDKDSISSFLSEIGQEQLNWSDADGGISKGGFGVVNFDTDGSALYLHFKSPDEAAIAHNALKNESNGIVDLNLQGDTISVTMSGALDENQDELPIDGTVDVEPSVAPIDGIDPSASEPTETPVPSVDPNPANAPQGKLELLQSMIRFKLSQKDKKTDVSIDDKSALPISKDPLGLIKELVNESINDLKKDKAKKFIQEAIDRKGVKKKFIKESIMKIFEDGINAIHEDQYTDALALAKQFIENPNLEEGVVSDKFKKLAKPFVIAAFLTVLGGKVDAAVEQYKKATGMEPSQSEIAQGIKTFEQKTGNKIQGGNDDNTEPDNTKPVEGPSLLGQDLGTYDQPGAFALDTNKVNPNAKLTDFKKINVDQAVAKYSEGGEGKSEFKELRGPRMDNKAVVSKPIEQLDDNKDSERLEKIWRIIGQNPEQVIQDGVVKNQEGKVLANNVELKPDGKIVFDFTFVNPDSKDYKDGKTPQKMLGGELIKGAATGGEKEVNMVWAKLRKPGAYDLGKIADPAKMQRIKAEIEKRGFKNQPGTNYWIQGEKGFWVDADKAKELYKQGLISFNNPNIEKQHRVGNQ
jgi:hypothetical protein